MGEAGHAQTPAAQRRPGELARSSTLGDLLPAARLLVHCIGFHEAPRKARAAIGAAAALRLETLAAQPCCYAHRPIDACLVLQKRHVPGDRERDMSDMMSVQTRGKKSPILSSTFPLLHLQHIA